MTPRVFAAVDIGASGGRVVAGTMEHHRIELHQVHRFPNAARTVDGHRRWDIRRLFDEVLTGLAKVPDAESIGIDTWAVDYGLLDERGELLADPIAYRDDRTATVIDQVHSLLPFDDLYEITGIQHLPFNTIYQLAAEDLLDRAAHIVLIPDLLAYWLTGELRTEATNASTTAMVDIDSGGWSAQILRYLDIPHDKLPPIEPPGTVRGTWRDIPVTTVGSHDTASAVVGTPGTGDFAYISSGTWSLVGVELTAPVRDDPTFTNERGVDGRIRFLKNTGGLWLLQECLREWGDADLSALLDKAARLPAGPLIAADDDSFIPAGDMPARIEAAVGTRLDRPATVRCIVDSLAACYRRTIDRAETLSCQPVDVVHITGGGSQNELLCQASADALGRPVIAGPVEATAIGNVLIQARTHGAISGDLERLRRLITDSFQLRRYEPT